MTKRANSDAELRRFAMPENLSRVVIKVGTRLLSDEKFLLDKAAVRRVAKNVIHARDRGAQVVLVTSGAVAAGMGALKLSARPSRMIEKQACAAVGQSLLMHEYEKVFRRAGVQTAQVLLTRQEITSRSTHQTVRKMLNHLLTNGILPVVNENDVVSVDELKIGDNDTLSGLVADLVNAELLVILTDIDGMHTGDSADPRRISVVPTVTEDIRKMAGGAGSAGAVGGMMTKVETAERMARAGRLTAVISGRSNTAVRDLIDGKNMGTIFLPSGTKLASRKRWIADHLAPFGTIRVDPGAANALRKKGGSLLAIGITDVEGEFSRGAPVSVVDVDGSIIGQGLTAYSSSDIDRIKGIRSDQIKRTLGHFFGEEVIHRNDFVISSGRSV